jgi:exodeoxyribonuclease V alpha subunit
MEEFKGYVEHIIYRNEENTYTVFEVQCEDGLVTCTGFPPAISEGESCIVSGEKVQHAVYGEQFKVDIYRVIPPENSQAMLRYLASGAVKGIGQALAARIVKKFGDDTLRVMDEEPERLAEIKGISERKAREIAAYMAEKRELRDAMLFLQQYGVTNRVALKIWKTYGARMYEVLRQNPYQLAEDIYGIGFATADEIAGRVGISTQSEFRIRSGILYTLSVTLSEGSSYLPREILLSRAAELLKVPDELIGLQLDNLVVERQVKICRKGSEVQVYSNAAWREEHRSPGCWRIWNRSPSATEQGTRRKSWQSWKKKRIWNLISCSGRLFSWRRNTPYSSSRADRGPERQLRSTRSSAI